MCNVFSGHIVSEQGKRWGEVIFLSGIHHELDRERIREDIKLVAWESAEDCSLAVVYPENQACECKYFNFILLIRGRKMAGTKEKPCKICKYNDLDIWLASKEDNCYLCKEASQFNLKEEEKGEKC